MTWRALAAGWLLLGAATGACAQAAPPTVRRAESPASAALPSAATVPMVATPPASRPTVTPPPASAPAAAAGATDPLVQRLASEGNELFASGRYPEALQAFRDAERRLPPAARADIAELKQRQGRALSAWGRPGEAAQVLQEALRVRRLLGGAQEIGESLHALADATAAGDDPLAAGALYEEALVQRRAARDGAGEVRTLINLAQWHTQLGAWGRAAAVLDAALARTRDVATLRAVDRAVLHSSIGVVRALLGQFDAAHAALRESARESRAAGDATGVAEALRNEAFLELEQQRPQQAHALFIESLRALPEAGDGNAISRARGLNGAGYALVRMQLGDEASPLLEQAVALLRTTSARLDLARALESLGSARLLQRRFGAARMHYLESLALARHQAAPEDEREVLASLGRLAQAEGANEAAILHLKLAVNASQRLRQGAATLDRDSRGALARRLAEPYKLLARLLVEQGRLAEAERVLLALKDAEFAEYLRGAGEAGAALELTADEQAALADINRVSAQLAEVYARWEAHRLGRAPLPEAQQRGLQDREGLLLQQLGTQLATLDERLAAARRARVAPALQDLELAAKAALLSADAQGEPSAVLMFVPEERLSTVLLATASGARVLQLPVGLATLRPLIAALHGAILAREDHRPAARALHGLLVEPVERELARTLVPPSLWMLLLTDELRYLPFAALVDAQGQHLVEKVRLSQFVSAAAPRLLEAPRPWTVSAFGSTREAPRWHLSPLPAAREEVRGLVRSADNPQGLLAGQGFIDEAFTREAWLSVFGRIGLPPPRATVVHVASHFMALPGDWNNSFLLLGNQDEFRISELRGPLNLTLSHLDLITLSACATEVNQQAAGRELEGLGALLLKLGARAVMGTLWSVQDEGTAALMRRFYAARGGERRMSKAAALQQAQLALLRGEQRAANAAVDLRHPYYWAPFVLMGNWL